MQLVKMYGLDEAVVNTLITTILDVGVSLVLGAGASWDCHGGDGQIIRGGPDLAKEINDKFSIGLIEPDASNLPLVYGDASQPPTKSSLNTFLHRKFTNCQPTWQEKLFDVKWKRIWSLNIDDVIQRSQPPSSDFFVETFNWFQEFKPLPWGKYTLQIIHLHGYAKELLNNPEHLIFSLKEYVNRHEATPGWHTAFRAEFTQKPFIICGAKLRDEIDLISVLEYGNRSNERGGCPSLIVLKGFAPGEETRFKRQGLLPITATGEEFFTALVSDVNEFKKCHPDIDPLYAAARGEMKEKFRMLNATTAKPSRKSLDFYASAETQWEHIVDNLDAPMKKTEDAVTWLSNANDAHPVKVVLLYGGPVSGKTSVAYRIGKQLFDLGYDVWLFRGDEIVNDLAIIPYLKNTKKLALIFDDCADYSSALRHLIDETAKNNVILRIIATCDEHRISGVKADIPMRIRFDWQIEPLPYDDFASIFKKRFAKGRLGRCTSVSIDFSWREFRKDYSNKLLEWLESLENAYPYRDAIVKIFKGNSTAYIDTKSLICATSAVQRFGYSLPLFLADNFRGTASLDVLIGEGGAMESLVYFDDRGLRLRSKAFAKFIWKELSQKEKFIWAITIVKILAPLVHPQTITRRTTAYLITRQLMDWENVKRDFENESEKWYEDLEQIYEWNARFWEQRALLASDRKDELKAYSYAKKAIKIHGYDSFPWTTLGKICVKIGVDRKDKVGVDRFWEGVDALEESRRLSRGSGLEWAHPYMTFFTYALRAYKNQHFELERERLKHTWNKWMGDARGLEIFPPGRSGTNFELDEFQRKWLLNAVNDN